MYAACEVIVDFSTDPSRFLAFLARRPAVSQSRGDDVASGRENVAVVHWIRRRIGEATLLSVFH